MSKQKEVKDLSFKEGIEELSEIVNALESNQIELEDSVKSYERGIELLTALKLKLDDAQQKIDVCMGNLDLDAVENIEDTDTKIS